MKPDTTTEQSPDTITTPIRSYRWVYLLLVLFAASSALGYLAYTQIGSPALDTDMADTDTTLTEIASVPAYQEDPITPIPTPTPEILPLPSEPQDFRISHGSGVVGPRPSRAIVSTLTPNPGTPQTITITVAHGTPVLSGSGTVITDNREVPFTLQLTEGTNTDGIWTGSWTLNDTYDFKYDIKYSLSDSTHTYQGSLSFR
jgi:hypothetical protein